MQVIPHDGAARHLMEVIVMMVMSIMKDGDGGVLSNLLVGLLLLFGAFYGGGGGGGSCGGGLVVVMYPLCGREGPTCVSASSAETRSTLLPTLRVCATEAE